MEKSDFCIHLINKFDELDSFMMENLSIFYDGITVENFNKVDGNHYFPPRSAQCLCVGDIYILLLCAKNLISALHENVLFPDNKF